MTGPDITRATLKSSGYNVAKFTRAVITGKAEDGSKLNTSMPRYLMKPKDAMAVWAYLATLK